MSLFFLKFKEIPHFFTTPFEEKEEYPSMVKTDDETEEVGQKYTVYLYTLSS